MPAMRHTWAEMTAEPKHDNEENNNEIKVQL